MILALYWNRKMNRTELPDYISHTWKKTERQPEYQRGGANKMVSNPAEKKTWFFAAENFKFSGIDYFYIMHTIPTNYTETINSEDSKYWVPVMWKEFDSRVENNTFEW